MCGRYVLKTSAEAIAKRFLVHISGLMGEGLRPRYNIAPATGVLAIWDDRDAGKRKADILNWGLVPGWTRDPNLSSCPINARSETAASKPSFRDALRYRRCIIPADGFYEWKRSGGVSLPHYITVDQGSLFGMAGLWEIWQSPDGSEIWSCCILTVPANDLMRPVHYRMPVILEPGDYDRWLAARTENSSAVADLLKPFPARRMESRRVSDQVNSVRNEGPGLIETLVAPQRELDFLDQLFSDDSN